MLILFCERPYLNNFNPSWPTVKKRKCAVVYWPRKWINKELNAFNSISLVLSSWGMGGEGQTASRLFQLATMALHTESLWFFSKFMQPIKVYLKTQTVWKPLIYYLESEMTNPSLLILLIPKKDFVTHTKSFH